MIDEVEQSRVGEVEVLEDHHHRVPIGQALEERAPCGEELLGVDAALEAEQRQQRALDRPALVFVGDVARRRGGNLGARLVGVVRLAQAGSFADHLAQRPEGDALAVARAAPVVPQDQLLQPIDVLEELPGESRFTDSARADDAHQPRPSLAVRGMEQLFEQAHLVLTADEWRLEQLAPIAPATLGHDTHRPPRRDRRLLALELLVGLALEDDRVARRALCGFADEHGSRLGHRLEAAGGVDQVTRDHALVRSADGHGRVAGQNAGTRLDARAERADNLDQIEPGSHGALGIVLLGDRRAPHGHHGIADELLDGAAVTADDLAREVEVAAERVAHILRVALLGKRREADEIGEEDADQASFSHWLGHCRGTAAAIARGRHARRRRSAGRERRRALRAELGTHKVDEAAVGAAGRERRRALHAELRPRDVVCPAARTDQCSVPSSNSAHRE